LQIHKLVFALLEKDQLGGEEVKRIIESASYSEISEAPLLRQSNNGTREQKAA
jgi:hypothetical protein